MKTFLLKLSLLLALISIGLQNFAGTIRTRDNGTMNWNNPTTWIRELTGTVTFSNNSSTVSGVGTSFLSHVSPGDKLMSQANPGTILGTVLSVSSNTQLILTSNASQNSNGAYGKESVPNASDDVFLGNVNSPIPNTIINLNISGVSIASLNFTPTLKTVSFVHVGANTLTVAGDVNIWQSAGNAKENIWNIGSAYARVLGSINLGGFTSNSGRKALLDINAGTLDLTGNLNYLMTDISGSNASVDMSGGAGIMNIKGSIVLQNNRGEIFPGTTSTINFNGSGTQTFPIGVSSIQYANLHFNNTSVNGITLSAAITASNVRGNVRVQTGILSNNGFAIAGNGTKTFEVTNGTSFNLSATSTSPTGFGTITFGPTSQTTYNGSNQSIGGHTYGHLTLTGSGIKSGPNAATVNGNFITSNGITFNSTEDFFANGEVLVNSGTTVTMTNKKHYYRSNVNYYGTFNCGTGTVFFDGSSAQTLNGALTFYQLTMQNAMGLSINNNITVNNTLTFVSGKISTGNNVVQANSTVSGAGSGTGWVNGNLRKNLNTGNVNVNFEVGDASTYAPLNYSNVLVVLSGSLTVRSNGVDHPSIGSSLYTASRTVNRHWVVTPSGLVVTSYNLIANFVAADRDPGLLTAYCQVGTYNGSSWTYPTAGTRTATSTQATGVTTLGDIMLGEKHNTPTLISITPNSGNRSQTMNVTFIGTNFVTTATTVNAPTGFTVNSVVVNTSTSMTVNISIAANAPFGNGNFSVSNPGALTSNSLPFNVITPAPTLTSISPNVGNRLGTYTVAFTGTNFISGTSSVNVGAGITVNSTTVVSSTLINANITITSLAAMGARNFSVSNTPGPLTSGNRTFTVSNPAPTLTSITANTANLGETITLDIVGSGFIQGVTSFNFGTNITMISTTVLSGTSASVKITVLVNAATGDRNITATNTSPGGGTSASVNFTITNLKIFNVSLGNWNVGSNWLPPGIPTTSDKCLIPLLRYCEIPIGYSAQCSDVSVQGNLLIYQTASLNVVNLLTVNTTGILGILGTCPTYGSLVLDGMVKYAAPSTTQYVMNMASPYKTLYIAGSSTKMITENLVVEKDLIIEGSLNVQDHVIEVKGNLVNNGEFALSNGTVIMGGSIPQTIGGTNPLDFKDLKITNTDPTGVTLLKDATISGTLSLGATSVFNTNGFNFTLLSDSLKTADIGPLAPTSQIVGSITAQRYVSSGAGYTMIGSPLQASTFSQLNDDVTISNASNTTSNIWYYNEPFPGNMNNNFISPPGIDSMITPGRGLFLSKSLTSAVTLDIAGTPNVGPIVFPVTYTESSPPLPLHDGWNLVSNPYPCTIDWNSAVGWTKTNIEPTIYCWDKSISDYQFYQDGIGGSSNEFIASHQGFWVKANGPNPILIVEETAKVTNSNQVSFYKLNTNIPNAISLKIANTADTVKSDVAYIRFVQGATPSKDSNFDSDRLVSTTSIIPNISTVSSDNVLLALNALPELINNHVIPVVVRLNTSGSFKFSLQNLESFPASSCIVLEDTETGTFTNLRSASYTCYIVASSSASPRFNLHVSPPAKINSSNTTCSNAQDGFITAKGQSNGPWSYKWKNGSGTVLRTKASSMNADTLSLLNGGSYTVEITNSSGYCSVISETIEIEEPNPLMNTIYPISASCFGSRDGAASVLTSGGLGPYEYFWSNGATASSIENLSAGHYTVISTDMNFCTKEASFDIVEPDAMETEISVSHVGSCKENNGSIDLNLKGGVMPYDYDWNSGASLNANLTNLKPGIQTLVITDMNGCELRKEVEVLKLEQANAEFSANADTVYLSNGASIMFNNEGNSNGKFNWNFSDGSSSTEQNPSHTFMTAGTYEVTLSVDNGGCIATRSMNITVLNPAEATSKFSIYPNPLSGDELMIKLKDFDDTKITIVLYDVSGKTILSKTLLKTDNQFVLDLNAATERKLLPGNYILSVITKERSISRKLIITRPN